MLPEDDADEEQMIDMASKQSEDDAESTWDEHDSDDESVTKKGMPLCVK